MAQTVDDGGWDLPSVRRYPWHEWTSGQTWQIRRGEDYDVSTENMRTNLHVRASQIGCKVRTKKLRDPRGEGLVFQFQRGEGTVPNTAPVASEDEKSAIEALYNVCLNIYETARREVFIPRSDGTQQRYAANRFIKQIKDAYAAGDLIAAVSRVVARRTQGFGHLERAGRPDLMLETHLLDETQPYYPLIPSETIERSRERMVEYWRRRPSAG